MALAGIIDRYLALPGELQSMIISFCSVNDRVCLSLANKTFYSLCANSIPKPAPLNTNQLLTDPGPSDLLPTSHPCYYKNPWGAPASRPRNGPYTDMCSGRSCTHSESFDCALSVRLRNWMPKGTRYCRECVRFTKRVKSRRKGACKCTRPSNRYKSSGKNWTYRKYIGYHRDFWKVHYTEADLAKVIRRYKEPRATSSPYGLRERTKPSRKLLEHTSNYQFTQNAWGVWCKSDFS